MASNNMYRVGDFVYFETSAATPYQIRRIDELNKTANGAVEAKVVCFYRRRDISNTLLQLADKHHKNLGGEEENGDHQGDEEECSNGEGKATSDQNYRLQHRELFLSRQVETLPATHIRGKCQVTLHNETEATLGYLDKEDGFFYQLVYDPVQRTLLADKGEMRVGSKYQAVIPPLLGEGETDPRDGIQLESLVWSANHSHSEHKLDEFILLARSVGTLARAYDHTSSIRQPNLLMSAAAASRDVTKQRALDCLFRADFDLGRAVSELVPKGTPWLCRDEMEDWSASEGNLFEEALEKYGKFFHDIHNDFLPWKSPKGIVEYYYMWKTTDHYVQQKRIKAAEAEHKLKQVYIPNYSKPNPAVLYNTSKAPGGGGGEGGRGCESCGAASSAQWYSWGPQTVQCKLCQSCWSYWKRYGGLKTPTKLSNGSSQSSVASAPGGAVGLPSADPGSSSTADLPHRHQWQTLRGPSSASSSLWPHGPPGSAAAAAAAASSKNRAGFCMIAQPAIRVGRRLCDEQIRPRALAKRPFSRQINAVDMHKIMTHQLSSLDAAGANVHLSQHRLPASLETTVQTLVGRRGGGGEEVDEMKSLPDILGREKRAPGWSEEEGRRAFPRDTATIDRLNQTVFLDKGIHDTPPGGKEPGVNGTHVSANNGSPCAASSPDLGGGGRQVGSPNGDGGDLALGLAGRKRGLAMEGLDDARGEPQRKRQQTTTNHGAPTKKQGLGKESGMGTLLFVANDVIKKQRRQMGSSDMRKLGRRPWKPTDNKFQPKAASIQARH